ncbi:MAG: HD domain-containing protein [Chloroflexi bacterium]|nr:HD domain-containing protein [Chloroflexota bacterium]
MRKVKFTRMADGTVEDYALLVEELPQVRAKVVDHALEMLDRLKGGYSIYQVSRYEHSLQSATLAHDDGADEELVVAALLHDIGDIVAPDNHSAIAAEILKPYVTDKTFWIVQQHGLFQGYYYFHHVGADRNARDRYQGHVYYQVCADFCAKYDQAAFDPNFVSKPVGFFEPMVRRVFARRPFAASRAAKRDPMALDLGYGARAASNRRG